MAPKRNTKRKDKYIKMLNNASVAASAIALTLAMVVKIFKKQKK